MGVRGEYTPPSGGEGGAGETRGCGGEEGRGSPAGPVTRELDLERGTWATQIKRVSAAFMTTIQRLLDVALLYARFFISENMPCFLKPPSTRVSCGERGVGRKGECVG